MPLLAQPVERARLERDPVVGRGPRERRDEGHAWTMTPDELRAAVVPAWAGSTRSTSATASSPTGRDESPRKLGWIGLPRDLRGRTVLDVGAWDGFFSFECERRGADRVVALDGPAWSEPAWGPGGFGTRSGVRARAAGARLARRGRRHRARGRSRRRRSGRFDVVLFLGVLYHLKHPWPVLERVASVCDGLLIVETHADLLDVRRPAMALYPGDELGGRRVELVGPERRRADARCCARWASRAWRSCTASRVPTGYARAAYRRLRGPRFRAQQGRVTLHARRPRPSPSPCAKASSEHRRREYVRCRSSLSGCWRSSKAAGSSCAPAPAAWARRRRPPRSRWAWPSAG